MTEPRVIQSGKSINACGAFMIPKNAVVSSNSRKCISGVTAESSTEVNSNVNPENFACLLGN